MMIYTITVDIKENTKKYTDFEDAIKAVSKNCYCNPIRGFSNTWFFASDYTAMQLARHLKTFLEKENEFLIAKVSSEAAWVVSDKDTAQWLEKHLAPT